ncbi:glycosyltransferase family 39 protein, partial [bacterium]|nr:glycosyltransferase family 39 protein [bacterium]
MIDGKINYLIKKLLFKLTVWTTGLFCFVIVSVQIIRLIDPKILPIKYKELSNSSSAVVFLLTAVMLFFTFLINRKKSDHLRNHLKKYFILLIIFGAILRIGSVAMIRNKQVSDFKVYHELAVSLTEGIGFAYKYFTGLNEDVKLYMNRNADDNEIIPTNFRPCGYPVILSLIYRVFGINPLWGKIFNILFSLVTGICLFLIFVDINIHFAYSIALFWFIYPANIFAVNLLGTETVYLSFLTASLLLLKKAFALRNLYKRNVLIVISGLMSGYGCLIRPYIFMLICVVGGLILTDKKSERTFFSIIIFVISFCVPLFLWGIRNYEQLGHFQVQPNNAGPTLAIRTRHIEPLINYKYEYYEKKMRAVTDE